MEDSLRAALVVIDILEELGVACFLGGSLASTIYGIPRSTLDADIVADMKAEHAEALVGAIGDAFYADLGAIQEAIRNRSSFNLIHLATAFKGDNLDLQHLRTWSDRLDLSRLVERALEASGVREDT